MTVSAGTELPQLVLRRHEDKRIRGGHAWVFSNEIDTAVTPLASVPPGAAVAVLDRLPAYKVRPAHDRFETGTPAFESIAGTLAATDYLRDVGRTYGDVAGAPGASAASERRRELVAGMVAIAAYERALVTRLIDGLGGIARVTIHGITDRARFGARVPTVSVSIDGVAPRAAAEALARAGIFAWDGDFYATGLIERLGKADVGGVLRLGLVHYNTAAEVDRTLEALERIAAPASPVGA